MFGRMFFIQALGATPGVLIAITVHEFFHALAAYLSGDDTAKKAGRLTLNPVKHLDPIGTLMLIFFHFGWARPVPINFWKFKRFKRDIIIVSLAGPFSNFVLGFITEGIFVKTGFYAYARYSPLIFNTFPNMSANPYVSYLADATAWFILINYVLFIFNLIPVPPLDGSKALVAFLPSKYMNWMLKYEMYGTIILLVLIFFGIVNVILNPTLLWMINVTARFFAR
ncbi:site-2 protease family protein [Mesoaciditoga sp.]